MILYRLHYAIPRIALALILVLLLLVPDKGRSEPVISVVAGNGSPGYAGDGGKAGEALLNNPFGVMVGLDGDIIFCDTMNHTIRRISRKSGLIDTASPAAKKRDTREMVVIRRMRSLMNPTK